MLLMKTLNILCFGDSLTAGWSGDTSDYHPYTYSLESSLKKAFPSVSVVTNNQGLPGDQVVSPPGGFFPRMDILYEEMENPYSWAIILGGTNDLFNNREADDIYEALEKVWSIPLTNDTKVLALTVPECAFCSVVLGERRDSLNDQILEHEAHNFYTLDLSSLIPYWRMPKDRREEIWDDGVHFKHAGYDLMGSIISERLVELISELENSGQVNVQGVAQKPLGPSNWKVQKVKEKVGRELQKKTGDGKLLRSGRVIAVP